MNEHASFVQLGVKVVAGGFIVHAYLNDMEGESYEWSTSIFTDLNSAMIFIRTALMDMEGPPLDVKQEKIGGMGVTP